MTKRERVYLKDLPLYDEVDHEGSSEQFPEVYARLDTLTHGSGKRLVWKCSSGHSWHARIDDRCRKGRGCPFCSGRLASDTNRLSANRPDLAREWDFDKNELTPFDVTVSSHKKAWWECSEGHSWRASVDNRSKGSGCPFCSGSLVSDTNRLSLIRPDLAREWDFDKNELTPFDVTVSSRKKAWWECSEGHSWQAEISSRSKGNGCPFCSGYRASDTNRLSLIRPDLAREWDSDKNELTPFDVTVSSGRKAWWECSEGHSWQAKISNRSEGRGCPKCANRTSKIENRFIEAFTEKTDFTVTAHGMRLNQLKYASGRIGVEVDIILCRNNHYLLLEYDGNYWHRDRVESDTEKSQLFLSLGDNILHARIREDDLPGLDLVHDRFAQFRHSYHATESASIAVTAKNIEHWFLEKIGG